MAITLTNSKAVSGIVATKPAFLDDTNYLVMSFASSTITVHKITYDGTSTLTDTALTGTIGSVYVPCDIKVIDTNKIVVAYIATGSGNDVQTICGTLSGTTITWGSAGTAISQTNPTDAKLAILSTTKYVVMIVFGTSNKLVCSTISGTTITNGTQSSESDWSATKGFDIFKIGTDKFAFVQITNTNNYPSAEACTVSGTTITRGTLLNFETTAREYISGETLGTDKFIVQTTLASTTAKITVASVSTTTITEESEASITDTNSSGSANEEETNIGVFPSTETGVAIVRNYAGGVYKVYGRYFSVSGTTVTFDSSADDALISSTARKYGIGVGSNVFAVASASDTLYGTVSNDLSVNVSDQLNITESITKQIVEQDRNISINDTLTVYEGPENNSYNTKYQSYSSNLDSTDYIAIGQSFFNTESTTLDSAKFYIKKTSSPTGNAVAKVYAHTGTFGSTGKPTGAALATSDNFDVSTLTASFALITFNFTGINRITLDASTPYVITFEYSGTGGQVSIGSDNTTIIHSGNGSSFFAGDAAWEYAGSGGDFALPKVDVIFYVYTDPVTSPKIDLNCNISTNDQITITENISSNSTLSDISVNDQITVTENIVSQVNPADINLNIDGQDDNEIIKSVFLF